MTEVASTPNAIELATELTIAWLSNPNTRANAEEVPAFLKSIHTAVGELSGSVAAPTAGDETAVPEHLPAVTVRKSLASRDHIVSMIDGRHYKTLRRHLSTHWFTPEDYRQRYNLKSDYPMVAHRRAMAHKSGLGAWGRAAKGSAAMPTEPASAPNKPAPPKAKRAPRPKAEPKSETSTG